MVILSEFLETINYDEDLDWEKNLNLFDDPDDEESLEEQEGFHKHDAFPFHLSNTNHHYSFFLQLQQEDVALSTKAFIKNAAGETLILYDPSVDFWDLPGGHVKEGETTQQSLEREVKEETGLTIKNTNELFVNDLKMGG